MNNENKNMSRRQAIKGIGAVALGTTALAASNTAKANENKTKKELDGKKRDDLQDAIAAIKTIDIGLPIEFINFRD